MKKQFWRLFIPVLFSLKSSWAGVTWEEQAGRLLHVQTAILDSPPFGEFRPINSKFSLGARLVGAIPPKVDGTVGGKEEKMPDPPLMAIPQLYAQFRPTGFSWIEAYAGITPAGAEGLLGVDGDFSQTLFGFAGLLRFGPLYGGLGAQWSHAKYDGSISSTGQDDHFNADTALIYGILGHYWEGPKVWTNILFGRRTTDAEFKVTEDNTNIKQEDDENLLMGINAGINLGPVALGLGEYYVPHRILMSRFLISYIWELK